MKKTYRQIDKITTGDERRVPFTFSDIVDCFTASPWAVTAEKKREPTEPKREEVRSWE